MPGPWLRSSRLPTGRLDLDRDREVAVRELAGSGNERFPALNPGAGRCRRHVGNLANGVTRLARDDQPRYGIGRRVQRELEAGGERVRERLARVGRCDLE